MKQKIIVGLVIVNLLMAFLLVKHFYEQKQRDKVIIARFVSQNAEGKNAIMSKQDAEDVGQIMLNLGPNKTISDNDLQFLLHFLKDDASTKIDDRLRRSIISSVVTGIGKLTDAQKQKIFDCAVTQISRPDDGVSEIYEDDKTMAIVTFLRLKDQRAIPYLIPLKADKRAIVSEGATHVLSRLGHTDITIKRQP